MCLSSRLQGKGCIREEENGRKESVNRVRRGRFAFAKKKFLLHRAYVGSLYFAICKEFGDDTKMKVVDLGV